MSDDLDLSEPRAASDVTVDLLSLDDAELRTLLGTLNEKSFRGEQIFGWLHDKRVTDLAAMTNLSSALRDTLAQRAAIRRPRIDDVKIAVDGTRKYQLTTHDGHTIESVWIPHASGPGRHALCISSQVGCAMGCRFCATASLKLTRHLTPGEIVGQVYAVLAELDERLPNDPPLPSSKLKHRYDPDPDDGDRDDDRDGVADTSDEGADRPGRRARRIHNVVYMGMGEPLHNIDGVIRSVRLLVHPRGLGLSPRRITVSTSGVVSALARLGAETAVHVAISLNATTDAQREAVMPVNKRWNLDALLEACRAFPADKRRRITFEYVMLQDTNDTDDDARRLAGLVKPFQDRRSKVNLIPFNPHPLSAYGRPSDERVDAFRKVLDRAGVEHFVRTTRGLDIDAACGMLGAKKLETARGALPVLS